MIGFDAVSPRPGPPDPGMRARIGLPAAEALDQLRDGYWLLSLEDESLARSTAGGLGRSVGAAGEQELLPVIERLERLREALAHLAIAIARTHGQLAWFLAQGSTVLAPVLRWRALTADPRQAFGTLVPTLAELTDAEDAVRHLQLTLTRLTTAADGPGTPQLGRPDPVG
ncbi:hypothetical protein ACFW1A_11530 [Kitasatospora sp. NPDC058965]|uniref:hypothetical protein n=1 Tax=Kitasatospora sp. NPDC058965 TaxID=3346682 RepID=UPI0036CBEA87